MIVEKRIAGIIRWLERFKQSYSSGAIENALMDAECAKADLEDLRLAVWSKARPKVRVSNSGWLRSAAYALPLSVMIVMLMVMPLSREVVPVQPPEPESEEIVLAEPIVVVREADPEPVIRKAPAPAKKPAPAKRPVITRSASSPKPQPTKQVRASVAYDKVPYLLQTGRQALRNSSTVIQLGR